MKIRSVIPFPLGKWDVMSRESAMELVGKTAPVKVDDKEAGTATITEVDWRDGNKIFVTIETEI